MSQLKSLLLVSGHRDPEIYSIFNYQTHMEQILQHIFMFLHVENATVTLSVPRSYKV